ncbi:DUF2306 domain-containing protein [Bacillus sp. S2(2024)]|uniref:DUF2306 domain-containing protein n=1 Tax=Bacillus sp. S2(2024) TaxID=3162887 RepID=UPI003D2086ED
MYLLYVHIIFGLIALLLGPLQFSHKIRQKSINTHKLIGKIYVLSIFISSCIGLYLSYYATGGWVSVIRFYSLTVAWMYTTVVGFLMIRKGNIKKHKQWMMRSYAVTLTFVTFRIWSLLVLLITQERGVLYGLTIIFSWVLNLLIVEWMFFKTLNGCKR